MFDRLDKEREDLIAQIEEAFKKTQYPKSIGDPDELYTLADKTWEELTTDEVIANHYFYFFSAEGFHYFLPAYLITILKYPELLDRSFVPEALLKHLAQDYDFALNPNLCRPFTTQQIDVVHDFLDLFQELFLPDDILDRRLTGVQPRLRSALKWRIRKETDEFRTLFFKATKNWMKCKGQDH